MYWKTCRGFRRRRNGSIGRLRKEKRNNEQLFDFCTGSGRAYGSV